MDYAVAKFVEKQIPAVIDVEGNLAGVGIYMPQSIKRGPGYANPRNGEALMSALKGRTPPLTLNYHTHQQSDSGNQPLPINCTSQPDIVVNTFDHIREERIGRQTHQRIQPHNKHSPLTTSGKGPQAEAVLITRFRVTSVQGVT